LTDIVSRADIPFARVPKPDHDYSRLIDSGRADLDSAWFGLCEGGWLRCNVYKTAFIAEIHSAAGQTPALYPACADED
jgi:hypothetical protein